MEKTKVIRVGLPDPDVCYIMYQAEPDLCHAWIYRRDCGTGGIKGPKKEAIIRDKDKIEY